MKRFSSFYPTVFMGNLSLIMCGGIPIFGQGRIHPKERFRHAVPAHSIVSRIAGAILPADCSGVIPICRPACKCLREPLMSVRGQKSTTVLHLEGK